MLVFVSVLYSPHHLLPLAHALHGKCVYCGICHSRNFPWKKRFLASTPSCNRRKIFLRPLLILLLKVGIFFLYCTSLTVPKFLKSQVSSSSAMSGLDCTVMRRRWGAPFVLILYVTSLPLMTLENSVSLFSYLFFVLVESKIILQRQGLVGSVVNIISTICSCEFGSLASSFSSTL